MVRGRAAVAAERGHRPLLHLVMPRDDGWGLNKLFGHRFPPMALLVLAALAERHGWATRIIDERYEPLPDERPDLAALTVWTGFAPRAYEVARHYRQRGVPVVLGGVHASLLPTEALRHADAVVGGEAELVLGQVLDDAVAGTLQPYYHGPWAGMEHVPLADEVGPIYKRFPYGRYRPSHTVQSTRGCRFNCDFCSVIRINGRGSRHAEIERIIEDIRYRTQMKPKLPGSTFVFFLDDDMASDLDHAAELFEALLAADLNLRWSAQASIGLCRRPELLALAARSGLRSLFCGFESVARDALVEANKKNRPSEYAELVGRAHQHGVAVEGSFIFGFDHDGPDVFDDTVEALDTIGVDLAHFWILTPYPGTHTFARYYDDGRILDFDWSHYTSYRAVIEPARMTPAELQEGFHRAYRRFYAPRRRLQRLRAHLGRSELSTATIYAAINETHARLHTGRGGGPLEAPAAPFEPHPDDLARLRTTSHAPASEAILTAAPGPRSGAPVRLEEPRRRTAAIGSLAAGIADP